MPPGPARQGPTLPITFVVAFANPATSLFASFVLSSRQLDKPHGANERRVGGEHAFAELIKGRDGFSAHPPMLQRVATGRAKVLASGLGPHDASRTA
jgi:hypothetical protein